MVFWGGVWDCDKTDQECMNLGSVFTELIWGAILPGTGAGMREEGDDSPV